MYWNDNQALPLKNLLKININMRCIEINDMVAHMAAKDMININMRCIEILLSFR